MLTYAIKRVGLSVLIATLAMVMLFIMIRAIPGDPATVMLGARASPETIARLNAEMGLDGAVSQQILYWFGRLATGNLGTDVWSQRPVADIVLEALPPTLALTFSGIGWAMLVGIPLGCYSALRPGTLLDRLTSIVSVGAISVPPFVLAIYLLLAFAVHLGWFPVLGLGDKGDVGSQLWHLVLPAFAVGLGWVGYLARLVRGSMLEVMAENHVRTARAMGLPEFRVQIHYCLRLAIVPTVTLLGMSIGGLLSSAVLVENVFARPGLGTLIAQAAQGRNYPVVQGGVFASVMLFVVIMPITDLLVAWLDPRVRDSL
jgi:peptide/nickel transport system permease protein